MITAGPQSDVTSSTFEVLKKKDSDDPLCFETVFTVEFNKFSKPWTIIFLFSYTIASAEAPRSFF